MTKLFHVSSTCLSPGLLKLEEPTRHYQTYTRGVDSSPLRDSRILSVLSALRTECCSTCMNSTCCPANQPCPLVAQLLGMNEELYHRAHEFVEHIFEWERNQSFLSLPSRFSAFFCWETLHDALWFRNELRDGNGFVYVVSPARADVPIHRGDLKWLDCLVVDVPTVRARAHAYWSGKPCPDFGGGRWEVLVGGDLMIQGGAIQTAGGDLG